MKALEEIRDMRYVGVWKTKPPQAASNVSPAMARYWSAVRDLESAIEERGHIVYDGHIAHNVEKVCGCVCNHACHWQCDTVNCPGTPLALAVHKFYL